MIHEPFVQSYHSAAIGASGLAILAHIAIIAIEISVVQPTVIPIWLPTMIAIGASGLAILAHVAIIAIEILSI